MRFARVALSALAGIFLATSSAFSADIAAIPPPPVWGFYFGGGVCYDWADFDIEKTKTETIKAYKWIPKLVPDGWYWIHGKKVPKYKTIWVKVRDSKKDTHETTTKNYEGKAQGPCLTATFGYDYQIDPLWIVGVFASYDWQMKNGDIFKVGYPQYGDQGDVWLGNIATVAGRAGMLVDPTLLVYGLVGWSWTTGGFQLNSGLGASGSLNGPTIGGGLEKLFNTNWSGRFEYRFTDFGSLSSGAVSCGWSCTKEATAKITDQSIRLVLVYRP